MLVHTRPVGTVVGRAGRGAPRSPLATRQPMAAEDSEPNLTSLLRATADGDRRSLDALLAAIYADLKRLAASHLRGERSDHTLQPTALAHEAYVKLLDQRRLGWQDRVHFFAVASRIIRRILVDHARERGAEKRGGGRSRVELDEAASVLPGADPDLLALDEALRELAELDETQARIVELRYFGGLTVEETAEALSIGKRSVDRHWQVAKAWLYRRLADDGGERNDG